MTHLTLKMTSGAVENDTSEIAVLTTHYIDREFVSVALLQPFRLAKGQKIAKLRDLTLTYDLLTLNMTSDATENDTIELAVLKNPDIDTDIVFLALLEVTLAQDSS